MQTADPTPIDQIDLSLTEWVVLALLAEAPAHGFALARELTGDSDLGRILTVHRPLVYRALDRLVVAELAEEFQTEPGDAGPQRTVLRPTGTGRQAVERWLDLAVEHIRDLRIEFLIKLRLNQRRGRNPARLISAQQEALTPAFEQLTADNEDHDRDSDIVDLWRRHNAMTARDFLDRLAGWSRHRPTSVRE